jgi:hypothetical protein
LHEKTKKKHEIGYTYYNDTMNDKPALEKRKSNFEVFLDANIPTRNLDISKIPLVCQRPHGYGETKRFRQRKSYQGRRA